jgi:hypothetical protein
MMRNQETEDTLFEAVDTLFLVRIKVYCF